MKRAELLKVAKPIKFNTRMVQAILDGNKSCTRQLVKLKDKSLNFAGFGLISSSAIFCENKSIGWTYQKHETIPAKYQIDDIVYVKEKIAQEDGMFFHAASFSRLDKHVIGKHPVTAIPAEHMPKEAARIFLKINGGYIQKLSEVTESDAKNEGFDSLNDFYNEIFRIYPDATKESYVFAYEFERVECE